MLINFEEEPPARSKLSKFLLIPIAAVLFVGTTMAANINIGSRSALEFGQGVQLLATCAPNVPVYLRPQNSFVNASGVNGSYKLSGLSLEGIQNSCIGYDFIIRAYGETSTQPLPLFDSNKTAVRIYQSGNSNFSRSATDAFTITSQGFGEFALTFDAPASESKSVARLTLEVAPHDPSMIRYNVGETGPGGGRIFLLPNSPGNATGLYFEATSNFVATKPWCDIWPIDVPQATGSGIGSGRSNTDSITSLCGDGAAVAAVQYSNGIASDWFLPSTGELVALFNSGISGLSSSGYWSSTQYDPDDAYEVSWPSSTASAYLKIGSLPVIPVRTFS
jgi:hypothetical protein